jgi:hypothetical protein
MSEVFPCLSVRSVAPGVARYVSRTPVRIFGLAFLGSLRSSLLRAPTLTKGRRIRVMVMTIGMRRGLAVRHRC